MYKSFLKRTFFTVVIMFLMVAVVNFIVDPGDIYLNKILKDMEAGSFSEKLRSSPSGIVQKGWNERLMKTILARSSDQVDCAILGSSHIMQISSVRDVGHIQQKCSSLVNLGVSGGSFEDLLVFSNIVLNQLSPTKHIYLAIDPWTLKFKMDSRYGAYESELQAMLESLGAKVEGGHSYLQKLIFNLFNGEYFYQSLVQLLSVKENGNEKNVERGAILYPDSFEYEEGYKQAVTLQDGSHIYPHGWIVDQRVKNPNISIGGGDYKVWGAIYDENVVLLLQNLLGLYEKNGVEVSFIMTPYHPNVFQLGDTKPVVHMKLIDKVVREVAKRNKLKVYGSFFPNQLGCKKQDFYDFMHPTLNCLNKIDFSQ